MNRQEFQVLATLRIAEAQELLAQNKPDGAYYLAGYAVECALKSCICKLVNQYDFPAKPKIVNDYYCHVIETLVRVAGLTGQRDLDAGADKDLKANWQTVRDWTEESRYSRKTTNEAENLITAITDVDHGVLPWIQQRW